ADGKRSRSARAGDASADVDVAADGGGAAAEDDGPGTGGNDANVEVPADRGDSTRLGQRIGKRRRLAAVPEAGVAGNDQRSARELKQTGASAAAANRERCGGISAAGLNKGGVIGPDRPTTDRFIACVDRAGAERVLRRRQRLRNGQASRYRK